MRAFSYARNPVDSSKDCQRLVDAILSHPNISSCDFESLLRGERNGHDYLVDLLRKEGMGGITFDNCGVNTGGQSTLFDIIKLHPNLVRLSLDKNKLNDKDAIHIADALRYNRTLEKLSLNENEFTSLGEDVMMKVICDDSSLNAAAGSNHVCVIKGLNFSSKASYVWGQYNDSARCGDKNVPKQNRARKIFGLLKERNKKGSNAHHMETEMGGGDTLRVVPLALAAIQVYGVQRLGSGKQLLKWDDDVNDWVIKDTSELSITYELVRSWHVTVVDGHNN